VVKFNLQATRWLGIWIDSSLALKHHQTMMKKARNAKHRLRRLTGRMGWFRRMSDGPKLRTSKRVRVEAMVGRRKETDTIGRANQLQTMVNQQALATTGCFKAQVRDS